MKFISINHRVARRAVVVGLILAAFIVLLIAPGITSAQDSGDEATEGIVWSADMSVVDLENVAIGAVCSDQFSKEGGSAGLKAKWLWSYTPERKLYLAFTDVVPGDEELTLEVGDLALALQPGDTNYTWEGVDVDWEDGQTIELRIILASATVVPQSNSPATGAPTIGGTAQVGETLTASTSGIADADGLNNATFSYQWLSSRDTEIQGANASTYTLKDADVGKIIKVRVSFTDDANNQETLTSDATEAVAARPNSPPASTDGICGRTQEVQDAIVYKLTGVSNCAEVTDSHLAGITWRLTVRFTSSQAIKSDDFVGLSALTELQLISDQISALPEDVFGGLDSLEVLLISISELQELPDNVFDGLGSLRDLTVGERPFRGADEVVRVHQLSALPEDVFDGLDSLEELDLSQNQLTVLPEDLFDGLDSLKLLNLVSNQLSALPEDVFDGLDSLEGLYLHVNNLSALPEDVFDGLDSLETLTLNNNQLTTLPEDVFDGLGNLEGLGLSRNQITTLPEDLFDGLDSLGFLNFSNNQITTLPEDLFDGLGSLRTLLMEYNQISGLHSDVFDGLSRLYRLELGNNQVAELPDGIFDGIGGLAQLFLGPNPGAPFTFTAELEQQGDDAVVVGVAKGAPSDMSVSLSAEGGVLSAATVTVAAGSTESDPITVTPSGDGDVTVSVDSAEFVGEVYGLGHARTGLGDSLTLTIVTSESSNSNSPATGQPAISGTARVDETLTASTSGIADADGLNNATFSYQWLSSRDTEIQGANASTYTLKDADVGKIIKVRVSFTDDANNQETLTSEATAVVEARSNSAATGLPTISGKAQMDETLTANTSGITDDDGLDNVSYSYQWIAGDADISGAGGSTYTVRDADEGKTIQVRVSFTDDAGNPETLTSDATGAVAGRPSEPLTVSLESQATSHDGTDPFTFELRFSEEVKLSYKTLRDHSLTVTNGTVTKAKRQVKGSNIHWRITVEPDSNADVGVVLPVTTDCGATGAICTSDGRIAVQAAGVHHQRAGRVGGQENPHTWTSRAGPPLRPEPALP